MFLVRIESILILDLLSEVTLFIFYCKLKLGYRYVIVDIFLHRGISTESNRRLFSIISFRVFIFIVVRLSSFRQFRTLVGCMKTISTAK